MAVLYEYPITVEWQGGLKGSGCLQLKNSPKGLPLSVPTEFKGLGEGTNPEELLVSAIASCYTITLGILATYRQLPIKNIRTEARGRVVQTGAHLEFNRVVLLPHIMVDASASEEQIQAIEEVASRAEKHCMITNAVRGSVEIKLEPTIVKL
jgi:peroxiredoxin-like protein